MARVTVEDCLEKVENRFVLIKLATSRARDLRSNGDKRIFESSNKEIVHSLREIAEGCVDLNDESREELNTKLHKGATNYDYL